MLSRSGFNDSQGAPARFRYRRVLTVSLPKFAARPGRSVAEPNKEKAPPSGGGAGSMMGTAETMCPHAAHPGFAGSSMDGRSGGRFVRRRRGGLLLRPCLSPAKYARSTSMATLRSAGLSPASNASTGTSLLQT